ncbi:P-loop containing nucleoside triphosphate hydrolase protein [Armillaria mellea]|nr:P-loop containing nucleoside triphosphate hydrolase protein [Armillaria mellea]
MSPTHAWKTPQGPEALKRAVARRIPQWNGGLRDHQQEFIPYILDGDNLLVCTATGDGKSAYFTASILAHLDVRDDLDLYVGFKAKKKPVGVVITPTIGLASNIVSELSGFRIQGISLCHDTIVEARRSGASLVKDVVSCNKYQVVCIDPEHLNEKEWQDIMKSDEFWSNTVYVCIEEAHLIDEWGAAFCPLFKRIGQLIRGRVRSSCSVFALTATLQPGKHTESPIPYLNSRRKTIIHCSTIDQVYRVYVYLWGMEQEIQIICDEFACTSFFLQMNIHRETIRLLDEDPYCQVIIVTVAFANSINCRSLLDSISIGAAKTLDQIWQEKGRVARLMEFV